jgi:hypothetical protein
MEDKDYGAGQYFVFPDELGVTDNMKSAIESSGNLRN